MLSFAGTLIYFLSTGLSKYFHLSFWRSLFKSPASLCKNITNMEFILAPSWSRWKLSSLWSFQIMAPPLRTNISWISEQKNRLIYSTGQVTTGGKFTGLARVGKLQGDYTPKAGGDLGKGAQGVWLWTKVKSSSDARKKSEKRSYLKQKAWLYLSATFVQTFPRSAHSSVKNVANELPLAQFSVRWCTGWIGPPPPSPLHHPPVLPYV